MLSLVQTSCFWFRRLCLSQEGIKSESEVTVIGEQDSWTRQVAQKSHWSGGWHTRPMYQMDDIQDPWLMGDIEVPWIRWETYKTRGSGLHCKEKRRPGHLLNGGEPWPHFSVPLSSCFFFSTLSSSISRKERKSRVSWVPIKSRCFAGFLFLVFHVVLADLD